MVVKLEMLPADSRVVTKAVLKDVQKGSRRVDSKDMTLAVRSALKKVASSVDDWVGLLADNLGTLKVDSLDIQKALLMAVLLDCRMAEAPVVL